ncbi:MAG TPA: hypothetical protein VKZ18_21400 [Polyangia bacterium]|nr:hypothetical protein [Polyangia bacterium]
MPELPPDEAIARAAAALGSKEAAIALRVERPDQVDRDYYLVTFGPEAAATAVAAVEAGSGVVMSTARLAGQRPHLTVSRQRALEIAAAGTGADAKLVWQPGVASRSSLYPIWKVSGPAGTIYVDQQEQIWADLSGARA